VLNLFLNPWMLLGLTGILLPVIAHLLSRKKYDQVDWGAMQFLELDNSAKRNVRLEEYLLMLVRMGIVALVAIAMARPWIGSDWLGVIASSQPRDVILIIDGSCSMGWDEKQDGKTPHVRGQQLAREFLATLRTGDAVQVIDARERPQSVLPESTRDPYRVKEAIHDLPPPAGSADLLAALRQGIKLLAAGTNLTREVVLFTDLQALSWNPEDETLWKQFDDLRRQSPITPNLWIVDTSGGELGRGANFSLEKLQLSRELAILGA
jgi:cbb3-type cytochrome oxidase subunit 3